MVHVLKGFRGNLSKYGVRGESRYVRILPLGYSTINLFSREIFSMKKIFTIIAISLVVASTGCTIGSRNKGILISDQQGQVCTPVVNKPDVVMEPQQTTIKGEEYSCWGCLDEEPYKFYPQFCCIQVTEKTCPDGPHVWCTDSQKPSWKKGKCWE